MEKKFAAVLSTTVLPLDGVYKVENVQETPNLTGVLHYIGHPDTKSIVESLGAVQAESRLFSGLEPGERAVCFPIQQGKSNRREDGFTSPHQAIGLEDLQVRIITRLDGVSYCPFCGTDTLGAWHCPGCGAS